MSQILTQIIARFNQVDESIRQVVTSINQLILILGPLFPAENGANANGQFDQAIDQGIFFSG